MTAIGMMAMYSSVVKVGICGLGGHRYDASTGHGNLVSRKLRQINQLPLPSPPPECLR